MEYNSRLSVAFEDIICIFFLKINIGINFISSYLIDPCSPLCTFRFHSYRGETRALKQNAHGSISITAEKRYEKRQKRDPKAQHISNSFIESHS